MARALVLISGGLDSILAARLLKEQGIEVIGICFVSPFFGDEKAVKMAEQVDIDLKIVDFSEEHFKMLKNPKHGYGKNMNPCIDCHTMMINYTGKLLKELNADFIATGEVLNQRPMSQTKHSLDIVKRESGYEELILRPLCAKNLPPTRMELEGIVDREKLLDISGRSRKRQMELAKLWNINDYPSPAGGCKLTEPGFSARLKDLMNNNSDCSIDDVRILNYGRHFRIRDGIKIISTRDQEEGKAINALIKKNEYVFEPLDFSGSTIILQGEPLIDDIIMAASICARYSKARDEEKAKIKYRRFSDEKYNIIEVEPGKDNQIDRYLIV